MEGLPQIAERVRVPIEIFIHPYMRDHCVEGQTVLPAVEALKILAASVNKLKPDANVACMTNARFDKFLYIHPDEKHVPALSDMSVNEDGSITAGLLTKTKSPNTPITRTKEHATVRFSESVGQLPQLPIDLASALEGPTFDIPAKRIYSDLVPFGPAYRNIQGILHISEDGAIANIAAPVTPDHNGRAELLGSPFPLDAAFHAACVWGQRFKRFVAFPLGFERRVILKHTRPGQTFFSRVRPTKLDSKWLVFDAWIYDSNGVLFEVVSGIRMTDISAGRMKPPPWITFHGKAGKWDRIIRDHFSLSIIEHKTIMPFAERALTEDELKYFKKMGKDRKKNYLAARLACKRLSRKLSGNDIQTPAETISTICSDRTGPCCPLTDGSEVFSCAASHDDRFAIAVASRKKVGVDVEKISERVLKCSDLYMDEEEKTLVRDSGLDEEASATRVWSIKEAVSKALNTTLADSWHRVRVTDIGKQESRVEIDRKGGYPVFHQTVDQHLFTIIEMS